MDPENVFDQEIVPQFDESDFIPMNFDDDGGTPPPPPNSEASSEENQNQNQGNQGNDDAGKEGNQNQDLVFNDDISALQSKDETQKVIEKLKAEGYEVKRNDDNSPDKKTELEINQLKNIVETATNFIKKPNLELIRIKFENDKAQQYKNSGRENMIGKEEFKIEVEAELSRFEDDPVIAEIMADKLRNEIKETVIKQNNDKLETINSELQRKYTEKLTENRNRLQESFKKYHKEGFLNVKPSPEEINEVYQDIISNNFAKSVKDNPNELVEFALFRKYKTQILEAFGGGTYGDGVADAFKTIEGKDKATHFGTSMNNQNSNEKSEKVNTWSSVIAENDERLKGAVVV